MEVKMLMKSWRAQLFGMSRSIQDPKKSWNMPIVGGILREGLWKGLISDITRSIMHIGTK